MNPATQPPAVHAGAIDPQIEADRIGYEHGYRGMENPSPHDDSIPAATFRARCVGWVRGHDDRRFGKPHQFADELASFDEEYRPTARSEFVPTPDDEAERLAMITADRNEDPARHTASGSSSSTASAWTRHSEARK